MPRRPDHPGSIRQRGDTFQVRLSVRGSRHVFTVDGTRKDAENFARRKYAELERWARRGPAAANQLLFSDLLKRFREDELPTLSAGSQKSYGGSLDVLEMYFVDQVGDPVLELVGRADVKAFMAWRRSYSPRKGLKRVSGHTVARDLRVLHRLFNYALDLEILEANPAARVPAPKADPRQPVILTADQYDKLLEAAGPERPMLRLYLLVLGETGARAESEALRLRWEDVDLAEGFIQIRSGRHGHRTKSGKSRWVPMTPRLRDAMRDHFAAYRFATYRGKPSPWVFHHLRTRRKHKAGERIRSLRATFEAAKKRAKLPTDLRQHDLRHRRVTTWLAEGKNPVHVKEALGHSTLQVTMGYTHLAREHLRALVDDGVDRADLEDLGT